MKLTRSEFFAAAIPALLGVTAVAAGAASRRKRNHTVNGIVTKVKAETGVIEIERPGRFHIKVVIVTDENTKYVFSDDTEATFEDVIEGAKIQAKGRVNQDASIQAKRILIKIVDPEE